MELTLDPKAVEVIENYTKDRTPKFSGIERVCINELRDMAQKVFDKNCNFKLVFLKGEQQKQNEFDCKRDKYFQGTAWYRYTWQWGRRSWGYRYWLLSKCERYFESNSERFILNFLHDTYGNIETAVLKTDSFTALWNEFEKWFEERRRKFMEQTDTDIQKWKEMCVSSKPQSHGGVANLLKVLTKTMEKQGADIQSVAKVQYAVCVQAGIYIPDEFIRDVAVALDIKEIEQITEDVRNEKY